jgi:hypothetical protein
MPRRSNGPAQRPATIALCLMLAATGIAVLSAATAHASGNYPMLLCAGNNGSGSYQTATNTISSNNPGGIFSLENHCGPAPDPAGNSAFLRIAENQSAGNAGYTAYGSISWTTTPWVAIVTGGGYTREPNAFNAGWRGRFWAEGWDGSTNNILMQGSGVANGSLGGIGWATTSTFAPHLWPFGSYGDYRRFVFEMTCYRSAGCDRVNFNAVDANTLHLTLADRQDPSASFAASSTVNGSWVRGQQSISWHESDQGSGLRFSRLKVDGNTLGDGTIDYQASGGCDVGSSGPSGEFARRFNPCPGGPYQRSYGLKTQNIADGQHSFAICLQDYGQYRSGGESCDNRTIRTDNTAPGKPASLEVTSANPARYLDHFGATFSLPQNSGSPITKVHYYVTDDEDGGKVVVPEKVVSATNPTSLSGVEGPANASAYILHVALEDQVGFLSPFASAPVPHDTTPPAAPQNLHVLGTTAHRVPKFDIGWSNITDVGSPIDSAHYQLIDASGNVVVPAKAISGDSIEAIRGIETPQADGNYKARVWLTDAEGNVGAAATVPLPRDTTPPAAPQDLSVAAPASSRASQGFDLRWRNITDDGSPIDAAHYQVLNGAGNVLVSTRTVNGENVQKVADIDTPGASGTYTLRLWLSDAEGNVGAPVSAPLSYDCMRSTVPGGLRLSAGFDGAPTRTVRQSHGAVLSGTLGGAGGGLAGAPVCVFQRVITDAGREFLGIALTDAAGNYRFAVAPGPSRELTALYRPDQRQLAAQAMIATRVYPTFGVRRHVLRNNQVARFSGRIPGPHNDRVVVVLQVRSGKGWRAFRRYRTRSGGRFSVGYRFTRTIRPTRYVMRAQVRTTTGYPYLQGNSRRQRLFVLPARHRR